MKKIYILIMLVLAGVFAQAQTSVWDGSRQLWNRGTGTQDNPFLIESAANLAYLSYMVGKGFDTQDLYFKLTTDIDLNGSEFQQWIPIGLAGSAYYEDGCERNCLPTGVKATDVMFKGHFDGDNHSISNIYINKESGAAGLFGVVTCNGTQTVVENVFVTNGFVKGGSSGGIVGTCYTNSTTEVLISRCWNGAEIEGTYAGGIVGEKADKIHNCYNVGTIHGSSSAGGIVGSSATEVLECYNNGAVTGDCYGGGIVGGDIRGNAFVGNCYNTGNISITGNGISSSLPGIPVGGIVGMIWQGSHTISNCYNVGMVACETCEPGGVVGGFGGSGIVENAYYIVNCGGEGEGVVKTAEEMRDPAFVGVLNVGTNVWCADTLNHNDGYPILGANNLAVDEYAMQTLTVYPNPTSGRFTAEGTGVISVYNTLGQMVLSKEIREKATLELPRGMYFIRLAGEKGKRMTKIVVR